MTGELCVAPNLSITRRRGAWGVRGEEGYRDVLVCSSSIKGPFT